MSGSGTGVSDASDETSEWKPGTLPPVVLQRGLIITTLRTLPKFDFFIGTYLGMVHRCRMIPRYLDESTLDNPAIQRNVDELILRGDATP